MRTRSAPDCSCVPTTRKWPTSTCSCRSMVLGRRSTRHLWCSIRVVSWLQDGWRLTDSLAQKAGICFKQYRKYINEYQFRPWISLSWRLVNTTFPIGYAPAFVTRTGPGCVDQLGSRWALMTRFLIVVFAVIASKPVLANGGTVMHEMASQRPSVTRAGPPMLSIPQPREFLTGCGRGRYRDPHSRKCRGPADIGN
jgi:hypothetical protein